MSGLHFLILWKFYILKMVNEGTYRLNGLNFMRK
jgi:hypothetical protein